MNLKRQSVSSQVGVGDLVEVIVDAIKDIKGKNIVKLELTDLEDSPTDIFIICEGESNIQVKSIADNLHKRVKEETGLIPNHTEGTQQARWILVDYFSIVVHIFYPETRSFYDLEDLWSDAEFTHYESI